MNLRRGALLILLGAWPGSPGARAETRDQIIVRLESELEGRPTDAGLLRSLGENYTLRVNESHSPGDYERARAHLRKSRYYDSGDLETRAWSGLLTCLEARELDGSTAKSTALAGLAVLDEVVEAEPKNLLFRVLRSTVGAGVPRSWGRLEQAQEDMWYVEYAVRRDRNLLKVHGLSLPEIHLKLGRILLARSERDEARRFLDLAFRSGDPVQAPKARKLLTKHFISNGR